MSINTTPNLHLPQWTADEQPSFLAEINGAWSSIDAGYGQNKTDAATAITASGNAVSIAEAAKQQSQANAGIITQLQQQLTQLEADFINQSYLITDNPTITNIHSGVHVSTEQFFHNGYVATGHFLLSFDNGTYNFTNDTPLFKLSNLPYVWNRIVMNTAETFGPNSNIAISGLSGYNALATWLESDGNLYTGADLVISGAVFKIDLVFSVPIFRSSSSRTGDMPDQCVFLK